MNYTEARDAMIAWYDGRDLPPEPLSLKPGETIRDVARYVEANVGRLKRMKPGSLPFRCAYFALYGLKQYIEATESPKKKTRKKSKNEK